MALQLIQEKLCCSICLDVLKDPVTVPCGHSFCMKCVKSRWDGEDQENLYSCPLCKQTFTPRPVVVRNVMFADLVEELKKTRLPEAPAAPASPGDVVCDSCSERKLKAVKSCLVCRVSYCELHLQPHYESPAFEKHQLVQPSDNLQDKFCSRHDEVMKIYCRTDQQMICIFCSLDEHKDHDTVSAAAERKEKSREVGMRRQNIQLRVTDRERDVKALQQEMDSMNSSADKAVNDSEEILSGFVDLIQRRISEVKEQIRSQQKTEMSRGKELEEKLKVELAELKTKDSELEKLSHTHEHFQFLLRFRLLSHLPEPTGLPRFKTHPLQYFEHVTAAVSKARVKLEDMLQEEWLKILQEVIDVDVLLPQPEPETREEFLLYSRQITLDPNTAHTRLKLSHGNRKATVMRDEQTCSSHPERFSDCLQVLGAESLSGRCYWEVERSSGVSVSVACRDISRTGNESEFGNSDRSWGLGCFDMTYYFRHNGLKTSLTGPRSSRIGVYLDHRAGTLSFYSVSETMTLLHRVQTMFTQPLYAGLWVYWVGDTVELCELK